VHWQDRRVISLSASTSDYHTTGEPFRIVTDRVAELPGNSVADRRARALQSPNAQELRDLLCLKSRGHADMYGGFLPTPDDDGAHLGMPFWRKDGFSDGQVHQRSVTMFPDGEVDRSPCGSGTCARLAILADQGRVGPGGRTLQHESIVRSAFSGAVGAVTTMAGRPPVVPQVTGLVHRTGEHTFVVDPADPLVPGFVLR
jgi:proline racemase